MKRCKACGLVPSKSKLSINVVVMIFTKDLAGDTRGRMIWFLPREQDICKVSFLTPILFSKENGADTWRLEISIF